MELNLGLRDIQLLLQDLNKAQIDLEMLREHHASWAKQRQRNELMYLFEHVKRMEIGLIWMLLDCFELILSYQENFAQPLNDYLRRVLADLSSLFEDLKKARMVLYEAYMHPSDLQHLIIDFDRMRRAINHGQRHLHDGDHIFNLIRQRKVILFPHHKISR